jgi:1,4-alpha-glucan branching enzyme
LTGTATFVLHSHLPYCRLAGRWPHGEEWLHQALLECYLPLIRSFRRLAGEIDGSLGVTINMTPILAEQIGDELMREHFREFLQKHIDRARSDVSRFTTNGGLRAKTARFHLDRYLALQAFYENEINADPLNALRALEASGHIEIASSAATHGYLPLLRDDDAVRFQIQTGLQSHLRNFGRKARSFWLPECAYKPGLERFLDEAGVKTFFVETHLVTGGRARGKAMQPMVGPYGELPSSPAVARPLASPEEHGGTTFRPYWVGESGVAVLARNERTGLQVWSASHGYPGDGVYREFHKKDSESGLHYWRLTGRDVDLGDKADYDPEPARAKASEHAAHFRDLVKTELYLYEAGAREPGSVVAAYDTELFGHWWLEGVEWLEQTIRLLARDEQVTLATAAEVVSGDPPSARIDLPEGSWGAGGDHRTWQNEGTAWTWPEIYSRQHRAEPLLRFGNDASRQLARELLLLQSSDWQFLMTTGQAHDYAMERFNAHCARFDALAKAIETGDPALGGLVAELSALDNPFPDINPLLYSGSRGAAPTLP